MATHAILADEVGLAGLAVEVDGLVAAVLARDEAAAAADALLAVELRIHHRVAVQVGGQHKRGQLLAHELVQPLDATLLHVGLHAFDEVVDDAIAILHDGRANLHVAAAQLNELQRVAPRLDAADATELHAASVRPFTVDDGVPRHLKDIAQGNGLHRAAAVSRERLLLAHGSLRRHRHALDGVDGRDGVGTGKEGSHGGLVDLRDVGRHLRYDGNLHRPLHVGRVEGHELGVLPHVATHAGQSHLRAREVQLHSVASRILSHLCQLNPLFLVLAHDAGHHNLRGVVLLQAAQDVEVHLIGILRQLLHVAEAGERRALSDSVETGRHLVDVLLADGLEEDATPPCLERPRHHLVVGADGRRSQEERVLAADAAEVDFQRRCLCSRRLCLPLERGEELGDTHGAVVVDTGLFSAFQVAGLAALHPSPGILCIVKPYGTNGSCRVALRACFRAGSVLAQQAACSLFLDVYHNVFVLDEYAKISFISRSANDLWIFL